MKRFRKKAKKVTDLVPDALSDKAASLNPLTPPKPEEPIKLADVPAITNESIAEHREDVLSGARKYIYPLQHSKHRIVVITTGIIIISVIAFLVYCVLALYRLNHTNAFLYRVTQVVPFPVARVDNRLVDYENYLFELRHYTHYYEMQLQRDFEGSDRQQLLQYRKQALDHVVNLAYVKILAQQNKVSVSDREVDQRINQVRNQNRLGNNNKVFADVLRSYWGWSINDFKRSLKEQILAEKVAAKLDTDSAKRAQDALAQVKSGAKFEEVAGKVSEHAQSKAAGGDYGFGITKNNPNIPPQVVEALFSLKAGQVSEIINTGPTLEIVKVIETDGKTVTAKHISINIKDISNYVKGVKAEKPTKTYIKI